MHRALLVLLACCAAPAPPLANHRPAPPVPIVDTELEALSFVVGCWRHWSVDWGFRVCWQREGAAWVGRYVSGGSMGPSSKTILRIARGDLGLTLTTKGACEPTPHRRDSTCEPAFVAPPRVVSPPECERDRYTKRTCAVGGPLVVFGTGEQAVWLGRDVTNDVLLFGAGYVTSVERAH